MDIPDAIDCQSTDQLVCPYCGYKHEVDGEDYNDTRYYCSQCERPFAFKAEFSVHFTSSTLEDHYNAMLRDHQQNLELFKDDPGMRGYFERQIATVEGWLAKLALHGKAAPSAPETGGTPVLRSSS